jgi:hypothetical protein
MLALTVAGQNSCTQQRWRLRPDHDVYTTSRSALLPPLRCVRLTYGFAD